MPISIRSFPNNVQEFIGAEEVMRWLHGRTSGVFGAEKNAAVYAGGNYMGVSIDDGIGWLSDAKGNGIVWWIDNYEAGGYALNVDMADAVFPRIDRVVVSWNTTNYDELPELTILKGTPAANPVPPALTNNNITRQISLAAINIPAGATAITDLMIVDERLNPEVCGIVTENVKADTRLMYSQYEEAIRQLKAAIAQAWNGEISDGSITAEKLDSEIRVARHYTGVIAADLWKTVQAADAAWYLIDFDYMNDGGVYAVAYEVNGLKATDHPIVDVDLSQAANAVEAVAFRDAWNCVDRCVVHIDDWLVMYCFGNKPTSNIPFIVKVV